MPSPADRRYNPTHEWQKLDAGVVTLGVSQFAVDELTDVTFVEVTVPLGGKITAGQPFGEIESVKTTSELYSGIDGTLQAVNQAVLDNPALINEDPWGQGWIVKIKPAAPTQLETLLDAATYDQQHV